jgi:PAS domain S-box-containing protein
MDETQQRDEVSESTMAARVRAFDWAATELGPIAGWPASLTTIVEVVLSNAAPMMLWWGEHAIQIYNDAARRDLVGDRDPGALGAPAAESWSCTCPHLADAARNMRADRGDGHCMLATTDPMRTWLLTLGPVPDGQGHTGGLLVIARQSSEGECADLIAERAARRAAERQCAHLRSIFDQAPAAIVIVRGPEHIVELSNEPMATAWGRRPNQSLGHPLFEAVPEARHFKPMFDRVYSSGQCQVGKGIPFRTTRTPDGRQVQRYSNFIFAPLRDIDGQIKGVLVIGLDITEELRAREEMERLRADAEAANRAKDEFLAMLGHELRNPLSPISTALQLMRMRGAGGRELDVLERQVCHLTRLVDDLLDVSRATRGKIELHRRDLELSDIVHEAIEVSSPLLEQRRHFVEIDVPREGLGVSADSERIVQAVSNLLTNAAKYSDPGSRITIRGTRADGKVRLSVRDRGSGIAPEMLGRVFDLFVQQPQTLDRAGGGLGLGLPIVRSLVELHGGSVSAASEGVGRGSEFTIELPALPHAVTRGPALRRANAGKLQAAHRGRILVVDDNADAAATLGEALEHVGYQVAVAHDGPTALRIAAEFEPDVALLDLGLPVMDGYELAEHLNAQRHGDRPHLVAVTGYGQDADRRSSARAGFERHLVKPIDLDVLFGVVAELAP